MASLFTFVEVLRKKEKARNNECAAVDIDHIFGFGAHVQIMVTPELAALWTLPEI